MARTQLTSLVTTTPNPKRWWRRLALLGLATGLSAMIVIAITSGGRITLGAGALLVFGGIAYRLRRGPEPFVEEYGAATYALRGNIATFTPTDGRADVHLAKADLRGGELTASDALILERRNGTTVRLTAASLGVLARIADDLGHAQAIVRRVAGGSPVSRLESTWVTGARIAYGTLLLFTFATTSIVVVDLYHHRPGDVGATVAAIVLILLSVVGVLAFFGSEVRVGRDGVSYRALVRRRFLAHGRIDHVKQGDRGVWLTLVDGREVLLPTAGVATPRLAEYIEAGRDAARGSAGSGSLGSLLDRGARTVDEWKRAVSTLGVNTGGYRTTLVTPAQLLRVVEDGGALPERRVAAAIALRNATGKKKRILRAARASADEALCAALEAAAEGEIAEDALATATARHVRATA